MTILKTQKERNDQAAALARLHVKVLDECAGLLGSSVDRRLENQLPDDPNSGCLGKAVFEGGPRRKYTLLEPGMHFGEIKVLGPIPGDLPEPKFREYFAAELSKEIATRDTCR